MKQFIKNNIIGFIIGGIIFGTIGVGAATLILASDISISSSKTEKTNVQDAIEELYDLAGNTVGGCKTSPFKEGDYVSMTPDATSYSISADLTGYSSAQTINPSELNMWRVIKINDDCTVDMVSSYVSSTDVTFGTSSNNTTGFTDAQVLAYKNFVGTLNTIASQYGKSGYTVKTRHVGYKNQTEIISDTTQIKAKTPEWSVSSGYGITVESQGGGDTGYSYDLSLLDDAIGGYGTYQIGTTKQVNYWLASRNYGYSSATGYYYSGRYVRYIGIVNYTDLHSRVSSTYYGSSSSFAVRPIVTLGSTIKIASGEGSSEANAYTLTK